MTVRRESKREIQNRKPVLVEASVLAEVPKPASASSASAPLPVEVQKVKKVKKPKKKGKKH